MDQDEYIKNRVDDQIAWYGRKSGANQRWFKWLRVLEIIAAATIPLLTGYVDKWAELNFVIGVLGLVIAVIAGVLGLYQFQENWTNYRATSESLRQEKYLFLTKTEPYNGDGRFPIFVQRVESLLTKEHASWAQTVRSAAPVKNQT